MPEETYGNRGSESMRSRLPAMALLFSGTLGSSAAFGMLLLLPLYVQRLGGDEADFGVIMASATFTAALAIGLVIRYPEALRPNVVLALAVLFYGLGAAGAALVEDGWLPLVGIGLLLGTAWAVVYAASPMVMSEMVTDGERATYFGYLTGTQQLGIGVGPVVAGFLAEGILGFRGTFLVAAGLCALAAILVLAVGTLVPDRRKSASDAGQTVSFRAAMGSILRSESVF